MALDVENSGNNRGKKSIRKNEKRTCIYQYLYNHTVEPLAVKLLFETMTHRPKRINWIGNQYTILELSNAQVLDVAVGSVETLSAFFAVWKSAVREEHDAMSLCLS